jgi:hypothetical protein
VHLRGETYASPRKCTIQTSAKGEIIRSEIHGGNVFNNDRAEAGNARRYFRIRAIIDNIEIGEGQTDETRQIDQILTG